MIVADWPEDIAHAARLLTDGRGGRLWGGAVSFLLLADTERRSSVASEVPHNAYHDAVALRRRVLGEAG